MIITQSAKDYKTVVELKPALILSKLLNDNYTKCKRL